MSHHNIIGSEAFDNRTHVMVRSLRPGGFRRRRARNLIAYALVAFLALVVGVAAATFALGPLLVDKAEPAATGLEAPLTQPIAVAPAAP